MLEKGDNCKMTIDKKRTGYIVFFIILISFVALSNMLNAQVRAGSAFLKMLPGTRTQGMGTGLAGGIDEMQVFYANPAATGFIREWQWSANYTKWIADVHNVSLNYGMHVNTFWSDKTKVAFGVNYQGVKEFDSTLGNRPAASANDLLAAFSIGNPLSFISDQIAIGANLKYLRSELVEFNTSTVIADVGAMYKSKRFNFVEGLLDYGYFATGLSVTQLGKPMTFKSTATPLPRALRAGASLDLGSHNGFQLKVAIDYLHVKDEIGRISIGSELTWDYLFSIRGGYNFNENLMSKMSLGLSVRLDDITSPGFVWGRNKAMRADFAALESNELFSNAYRGSLNHYPIGPENFGFLFPAYNDTLGFDNRYVSWSPSRDPDLFDDVGYVLLVEKAVGSGDNLRLKSILDRLDSNDDMVGQLVEKYSQELAYTADYPYSPKDSQESLSQAVTMLSSGEYYWTVLAHDRDFHYRKIKDEINKFNIVFPDIIVNRIEFEPDVWITESDTQGVLRVEVTNMGELSARHVALTVYDSLDTERATIDTIYQTMLHDLAPTVTKEVRFTWKTRKHGFHNIRAVAEIVDDEYDFMLEEILHNNVKTEGFYTIPKGRYAIADTADAYLKPFRNQDIPINSKVFFDEMSSELDPGYYDKALWFYAPLEIMANRVKHKNGVSFKLAGYADSVSNESVELAKERVLAVKNALVKLGIDSSRILEEELTWEASPSKRVSTNLDVLEERRFVRITAFDRETGQDLNRELFHPVVFKSIQAPLISLPIEFESTINGVIPVKTGRVIYEADTLKDTHDFDFVKRYVEKKIWNHNNDDSFSWLGRFVDYQVIMTDTLGRHFRTRPRDVLMGTKRIDIPSTVGLAEFNNPVPFPVIPWDSLFDQLKILLKHNDKLRIRFIGHACGIPPSQVNRLYSRKRAETFKGIFMKELLKRSGADPELKEILLNQVDHRGTIGLSAEKPFEISIDDSTFYHDNVNFNQRSYFNTKKVAENDEGNGIIPPFEFNKNRENLEFRGDNETPNGRQLNRRIEIQVYSID